MTAGQDHSAALNLLVLDRASAYGTIENIKATNIARHACNLQMWQLIGSLTPSAAAQNVDIDSSEPGRPPVRGHTRKCDRNRRAVASQVVSEIVRAYGKSSRYECL